MTYDKENLAKAITGDQNAFSKIYEAIYSDLYRLALYMCGNTGFAEDIVSETILDAYKGIHNLKSAENFEPWILKILSAKVKRSFKKNYNSFSIHNPMARSVDETELTSPDLSEEGIHRTDLLNAMSSLKAIDRMIISLCVVQEYTSGEAAEILSMNASSLRSRLNRSLKKLKKELEENGYE
jgi:RNA polymerase sigma-70 factor (ECF subfamily)